MEQFSFGRVFSRGFGLIGRSFGSVGVFLLVLLAIETGASLALQPMLADSIRNSIQPDADGVGAATQLFTSTAYLTIALIGVMSTAIGWAGGIHGLLATDRGRAASLPECFQVGLRLAFPMLGLIVLWWLGVALGWVFLFVPAAILASMWVAAAPARVGEAVGVFGAFGRSRGLTRGHRLSIFGVLVVLIVLYYVLMFVLVGAYAGTGMFTSIADPSKLLDTPWWATVLALPISFATGYLLKAMVASIYLELLLVKEGGRAAALTEVFD